MKGLLLSVNQSTMDLFIIKTGVKRETTMRFSDKTLNNIRKNFPSITYTFPTEP